MYRYLPRPGSGRGGRLYLEDVSWFVSRVEANVISPSPPVRLTGKLVGDYEVGVALQAKRGQVKPDGRLSRLVRVEVHDDQDRVLLPRGAFGKADQLRLVDVMKA